MIAEPGVNNQVNRVVSHPTLPVTITAHEDRHIRFFDNNTGAYFKFDITMHLRCTILHK